MPQAALKTFTKAEAGARLAYTFMNDGVVEADDAAIQTESTDAKAQLEKLEKVEWALDARRSPSRKSRSAPRRASATAP